MQAGCRLRGHQFKLARKAKPPDLVAGSRSARPVQSRTEPNETKRKANAAHTHAHAPPAKLLARSDQGGKQECVRHEQGVGMRVMNGVNQ